MFQAGLPERRAEVWGAGIDRLRSLIPRALDVLASELDRTDSPHRCKVACQILALAKPAIEAPQGPTDAEKALREKRGRI